MVDVSTRTALNEGHAQFRDTVRKPFARALISNLEKHEHEGIVGRELWLACGEAGLFCPTVSRIFGRANEIMKEAIDRSI